MSNLLVFALCFLVFLMVATMIVGYVLMNYDK